MKLNKYISIGLVSSAFMFASCSDFLDMSPDQRTEINTPEAVRKLLVSAYPSGNWSVLGELSSDNVVDNNSPHVSPWASGSNKDKPVYFNLLSMEKMDDEIFAFEPAKSSMAQDSPSAVWQGCYAAIATANHALEAIAKFEAEGIDPSEYEASKGEALLVRAFNHFILANVFCQAYRGDEASSADLGIPYVTEVEDVLQGKYERGTVTDVYKKIEADLLAGLPLIDDASYTVAKYHFNTNAANAFAARFYLYKHEYDKVIEYANLVLGGEDASAAAPLMRDYTKFEDCATSDAYANVWLDYESPSTLLFIPTYSVAWRVFASGYRYGVNHEAAYGSLYGWGPTWRSIMPHPYLMAAGLFLNGRQDYGLCFSNNIEKFEYTDKVAGIGYPHIVRREFTTEETLLCRAEAYLMKAALEGNEQYIDKAFADLSVWEASKRNLPTDESRRFIDFTKEAVREFYTDDVYEYYDENSGRDITVQPTDQSEPMRLDYAHMPDMGCPAIKDTDIEYWMNCVLHFRRLETIHDGNRFFDLKRLGIEYEHWIGKDPKEMIPERIERLTWNDPRRALQIPQEVIAAGMQANEEGGNSEEPPFDLDNPGETPGLDPLPKSAVIEIK